MSTAQAKNTDTTLEKAPRPGVIKIVTQQIEGLVKAGRLHFPADYSLENALAFAKLALLEVQNLDKQKILDPSGRPTGVVTEASIVNAVFDMAVQGMNVAKRQGYFIVYGKQLVFQRSYFGDQALVQRLRPGTAVYFDTIREGEKVELEKTWSKEAGYIDAIKSHAKSFPRSPAIIGAYCGLIDIETGTHLGLTIFDIDRIRKSWSKSKTYKPDAKSGTHADFEEEMAIRTVIRRACKPVINSSNDALLLEAIRRESIVAAESGIDEEAEEHANGEIIDVTDQLAAAAEQAEQEAEPEPEAGKEVDQPPTLEEGPGF